MILKSFINYNNVYVYIIGHYNPNGCWETLVEFNDLTTASNYFAYLMGN